MSGTGDIFWKEIKFLNDLKKYRETGVMPESITQKLSESTDEIELKSSMRTADWFVSASDEELSARLLRRAAMDGRLKHSIQSEETRRWKHDVYEVARIFDTCNAKLLRSLKHEE